MSQEGMEICAVVDPDEAGRLQAEKLAVPCYSTVAEMLEKAQPDGVVLATPTVLHAEQGLECINAGCPVLIEKPIAVSVDEAKSLVAASELSGVPVLVGHHRRYNPLIQQAHRFIVEGRLGELRTAQATCWFYKPDDYFEIASWRKQKGAGPVSVNLVHDIDLLRYLCGEVVSVQAQARPSVRGFDNEDVAAAVLLFDTGVIATISVSDSVTSPWSWELTSRENPVYPSTDQSCYLVGGSLGSLSIPDMRLWQHTPSPDWWSPITVTREPRENSDPLVNQMLHFAEVIRAQAAPLVSAEEGLRSLEVIEAIQKAAESGECLRLT